MSRKETVIIGVMGPGKKAGESDLANAEALGRSIAEKGWILLSGGRDEGVMDAVNIAARAAGGLTVGILPTKERSGLSAGVVIPIVTGMGSARNNINVLSSDVVIACGMGTGTASEIALALKSERPVILLGCSANAERFFSEIGGGLVQIASSPQQTIEYVERIITN